MRVGRATICAIYGLRYLVILSRQATDRPVKVADVVRASGLSAGNLGKIFQHLVKSRMLNSDRGPKGGFWLNRPASEISLFDIIEAMEGPSLEDGCLLTPASCQMQGDCLLGERIHAAEMAMNEVLRETSLEELSQPCVQCPNPRGEAFIPV